MYNSKKQGSIEFRNSNSTEKYRQKTPQLGTLKNFKLGTGFNFFLNKHSLTFIRSIQIQ